VVRVRRIALFLVAFVMFVGTAPTVAGSAASSATSTGRHAARSASEGTSRRDGPKLATLTVRHRSAIATSGSSRRSGERSAKLRALCAANPCVAASAGVAGVDDEANARLLRASNTPCCVRGPPAAA
jgi:hypothetical protein